MLCIGGKKRNTSAFTSPSTWKEVYPSSHFGRLKCLLVLLKVQRCHLKKNLTSKDVVVSLTVFISSPFTWKCWWGYFLAKSEQLQTQVLVWVLSCFSGFWLFETQRTVAPQALLSIGFSRQAYWRGLPCPLPGHLPYPGIEPVSHWWMDSLPLAPPTNTGSQPNL